MSSGTVPAEESGRAAARRREQRGWYVYDWACSVYSTSVLTVFLGPYLTSVAKTAADSEGYVHPLGIPVAAGSFFAYTVSLSVILAIVVMPLAGAAADRTGRKKPLLALSAYLGAAATAGMFFLDGDRYLLGGLLLVVANASLAVSMVLYNSYLPQIAEPEERDAVSSKGWAFGYASGALVLLANLVLYTAHDSFGLDEATAVRICLASAGVWWGAFTLVPLRRLRDHAAARRGGGGPARRLGPAGGDRQGHAAPSADPGVPAGVPDVQRRRADGDQPGVGLRLRGAGAGPVDADRGGAAGAGPRGGGGARHGAAGPEPRRAEHDPGLAGGVDADPGRRVLPRRGSPVWFFVLAAFIGTVLGGTQALSRSLFSHLVPAGKEAEYFAAFEMSDRGMSWLGPLLFGLTYQFTGSYRDAILSLILFFVIGFVLLARVPVRRAVLDAGNPVPGRI